MKIPYSLKRNRLKDDKSYTATVRSRGSIDENGIVNAMVGRGNMITEEDARAMLIALYTVVVEALVSGYTVKTPLVKFKVSIRGKFTDDQDVFDPARHHVHVNATMGTLLREALSRFVPEKQDKVTAGPEPESFYDLTSGAVDSTVTPSGMGRLTGFRLEFDPADPAQGIFFIGEDGSRTRVTLLAINRGHEQVFQVPTLTAGQYRLEVSAANGKKIRSDNLEATLTVA